MYNIPILLVFFNRPEKFKMVFDEIKKIKPTQLYLYQDGPRLNNQCDIEKIRLCREIIQDIDWECEIHTLFQEQNVGCDPSGYKAHSWFFSNVDYGIVLEDDCVPSSGFFDLCEYALPKYKNDDRISMISGMNLLGLSKKIEYPYFFSAHGGIWGWASWARFYKLCDPSYKWLDNKILVREIVNDFSTKSEARKFIALAKKRRKEGIPYFETMIYAAARSRHMLEIIPTGNTIMNVGVGSGAHTNDEFEKMSRFEKRFYFQKTYPFNPPLSDVPVVRNRRYEREILMSFYDKLMIRLNKLLRR